MPVDITQDSIRVRVKDPGAFQEGSFRTITISAAQGIKAVIGRLKGEMSTTVQTYIFDKEKWDSKRAQAWVSEHKKGKALSLFDEWPDDFAATSDDVPTEGDSSERETDNLGCIKILGGGRVGGYAILWGDADNRDLTDEFFRPPGEQGYLDIYKAVGAVPWFYHHGGDPVAKADPAGITDIMVPDGKGVWYETQLRKSHAYLDEIQRLIEAGALFTSSGTPPAARKVAPNGEITYWPISEVSGTTTPAEWRMIQRPIEAIRAAYKAIGFDFPSDDNRGAGDARQATEGERLNLWLDLYEVT